jgi:hypothetical protein
MRLLAEHIRSIYPTIETERLTSAKQTNSAADVEQANPTEPLPEGLNSCERPTTRPLLGTDGTLREPHGFAICRLSKYSLPKDDEPNG